MDYIPLLNFIVQYSVVPLLLWIYKLQLNNAALDKKIITLDTTKLDKDFYYKHLDDKLDKIYNEIKRISSI